MYVCMYGEVGLCVVSWDMLGGVVGFMFLYRINLHALGHERCVLASWHRFVEQRIDCGTWLKHPKTQS